MPNTARLWRSLGGLLLLGLLTALFAPALSWLLRSWLVHPYYSHGVLMPAVAVWFALRARGELLADPPDDAGYAVVAAGLVAHLAALRWAAHPLSIGALLIVLLGLSILAGGRRALRAAALPVALLGLAIPAPFIERLAPPLAGAAARGAVLAAGSVGAGAVQVGAQLVVGGGAFTVGAPCSGLRSIIALATLAVIIAGVAEGPRRSRLALVALALPLAFLVNWLRLTGFVWLADVRGAAPALGMYHAMASPLLFATAALALLAAGGAIGCHVRIRD
jgi:exosortase